MKNLILNSEYRTRGGRSPTKFRKSQIRNLRTHKISGFAICGGICCCAQVANSSHILCLIVEHLRIGYLRKVHLRSLPICRLIQRNLRIWNFRHHIPQKFAAFLRIERRNLRICAPTFSEYKPFTLHTKRSGENSLTWDRKTRSRQGWLGFLKNIMSKHITKVNIVTASQIANILTPFHNDLAKNSLICFN